jgi:multidrug efflux system outer membrane protein
VTRQVLLGLVAACGCALGPDYQRPTTPVTATFRGQDHAEAASFADLPWWDVFRDPPLTALIGEALQNSYGLQDAVARVEVTRQNARVATDALLPALGVQASPSYQQVFFGAVSGINIPNLPSGNIRFPSYLLQGTLSWEIDLWGQLRRLRQSALAQFLASEENRRGVIVSLIGDVAQGYFSLMALDLQLGVARRTIESREETLALFREREAGGVGSALDTASQEALLAGARATIPNLERQIVQAENQIGYLMGRAPGPIRRSPDLRQHAAPPDQPLGLPASLLERRPDVRQAEAQVVSANAEVGAALAGILPQLSFNGNGGVESASLSTLLTANAVTFLVQGLLNGVVPLLNGAQNVHRYRGKQATFVAAVVDYRRTVLGALHDVSDALVALKAYRQNRAELEAQVRAQIESVRLAKERFTSGVASYLDVVQAEQNLFPTELLLAQTIGAQFVSLTQLYRALGGGWRVPPPAASNVARAGGESSAGRKPPLVPQE